MNGNNSNAAKTTIEQTFQEQLALLSKASHDTTCSPNELAALTFAMLKLKNENKSTASGDQKHDEKIAIAAGIEKLLKGLTIADATDVLEFCKEMLVHRQFVH